jgi:ankyrin repeat protein
MFYAVNDNRIEIVRKYATKERVNHQDNLSQQTPLYYAARRGHIELCRILIEKGADIGHIDSTGKSAIEFAKKAKFNEVADLLASELKRLREVGKFSLPSQSF